MGTAPERYVYVMASVMLRLDAGTQKCLARSTAFLITDGHAAEAQTHVLEIQKSHILTAHR